MSTPRALLTKLASPAMLVPAMSVMLALAPSGMPSLAASPANADPVPLTPPAVTTGGAPEVSQSSAEVTGSVDPEGIEAHYYYEYGPTTEYGQRTPALPGVDAGTGSSPVNAAATLVPLTPGVTYHYRLVATNADGTSHGDDQTFTTLPDQPPGASTGPASGVSVNAATIAGTVDPRGVAASYRFEYGTDTSYGTQTFGTVTADLGVQTVTLDLRGLEAGTTYHYRLVAGNPGGTTVGEDATFTTPPIASPILAPAVTPLIGVPSIAFPKLVSGSSTPKTLTKAQKLAAALKACAKKPKRQRAGCQKQARKRYGYGLRGRASVW
ncbi:MAG TPA: hypothetical protein VK781_11475 [Solirubrobacteraceae bacterium]|jgi:hypothetical protein|nr:hypothetical protein [Solirubrobacteraceae bacterium]